MIEWIVAIKEQTCQFFCPTTTLSTFY